MEEEKLTDNGRLSVPVFEIWLTHNSLNLFSYLHYRKKFRRALWRQYCPTKSFVAKVTNILSHETLCSRIRSDQTEVHCSDFKLPPNLWYGNVGLFGRKRNLIFLITTKLATLGQGCFNETRFKIRKLNYKQEWKWK